MLVDVCFDSTSESTLKLAARENYPLGEIAVFPDDVCFGAINTMAPKERMLELEQRGYSINQDFEQQYEAFLNAMAQAEALRIWMLPYPYAKLGLLYIYKFSGRSTDKATGHQRHRARYSIDTMA